METEAEVVVIGSGEELGADIEWVQGGNLGIAATEERMEQYRGWLPVARDFGLDTRVLSRGEVQRMIPALEGPFVGGMCTPSDCHAEPRKATTAFARAAQERGAAVFTHCAAEGIEVTAGKVSGVRTEQGLIRASVVVCAAGAWSTRVAKEGRVGRPRNVLEEANTESARIVRN